MLVQKDVEHLLNQLSNNNSIDFDPSNISIRFFDDTAKVFLTAVAYTGSNYIPQSVRKSLLKKNVVHPSFIKTYFSIDEDIFQIKINYLGHPDILTRESFKDVVHEFGILVEKWRLYLDEHDKRDLIHVRTK